MSFQYNTTANGSIGSLYIVYGRWVVNVVEPKYRK